MARDHAKAVSHSLAHVRKLGEQGHHWRPWQHPRSKFESKYLYGLRIRHFFTAYVVLACVIPWWREHFGTVSHNGVSGVRVRFWYVSAKHVCSFWYVGFCRSIVAAQSCPLQHCSHALFPRPCRMPQQWMHCTTCFAILLFILFLHAPPQKTAFALLQF